MGNNDFRTDVGTRNKGESLRGIRGFIYFAILLTGIVTITGTIFIIQGGVNQVWQQIGVMEFAHRVLLTSITGCAFIALIKIRGDANPFSKTLIGCIQISSIIVMSASILFPRLTGYQSSGFEIFSTPTFVLIDGFILIPGLLLFILSVVMKAGYAMQNEIEEIL